MTITLLDAIQKKPGRFRFPPQRGLLAKAEADGPAVDSEGGSRGAGIIRGASLIAVGEALGHDAWIDQETLTQVAELGNEASTGIKVRFTHPGMSSDGLGTYLGRAKSLEVVGDQVVGDVHFSPTSRETPDGDRGGYVMDLATEDPEAFGMSIIFDHDFAAESNFVADHSESDEDGRQFFTSPDESNLENFPHVRLSVLHGADFVDEPAANPSGLFHATPTAELISQASNVLDYVFGFTNDIPEDTGGLSAERLRGFFTRFAESRRIAFTIGGDPVAKTKLTETEKAPEAEATPEAAPAPEEVSAPVAEAPAPVEEETVSASELSRFVGKFGAEAGVKYLQAGTSFEDALSEEFDALKQKQELGSAGGDRGEEKPVGEFAGGDSDGVGGDIRMPTAVRGMASVINGRGFPSTN